MRVVKYLTVTVLLCAVMILAETTQLMYTVNFAFGSLRAYYEIQIVQSDLHKISEIAKQHDVTLCIVDNQMTTKQEFYIYSTANEKDLCDELRIQNGTFKSVFYKKPVRIQIHNIEDYEVSNDTVKLYFTGNHQTELENALESDFIIIGGVTAQQDPSSMLIVTQIAWGILIVFTFFLSAFDTESKRRISFVRIMNGVSPFKMLLLHIGIEIFAMTGIISVTTALTGLFVTIQFTKQLFIFFGLLILASMIPYFKLTGVSYKIITQERLSIARLLNFGYIYKTVLLCMTMVVFSLTASLGTEFFNSMRILRYVREYEDYSIVKIETAEVSLLGDIDVEQAVKYSELTNLRIEEYYRKYYDSNNALMITPYGLTNGHNGNRDGFIYCNSNANSYIMRLFGDYQKEINADVCIFVPDDISDDNRVIMTAEKFGIPNYTGMSWNPDIKIIHYSEKKTGFYLSCFQDSLLGLVENPIVVYVMRTPDEVGVPINDTQKVSSNGSMAFCLDNTMLNDLQTNKDIHCEITPIGETVHQQINSVKRICAALGLICVVFVALNIFVSAFLIRMEYRLRAREYCIKTILGYTMLQKFGSFLTMSLLSIMVSIIMVIIFWKQLSITPVILTLICGSMLVIDTLSIFIYAMKTEQSSIVNCLKGGAL